MILALAMTPAGAPSPAPAASEEPTGVPEAPDARPRLRAVALRADGVDASAVADALRLRLAEVTVTTGALPASDPDAPALDLFAKVEAGASSEEVRLTLVASDGRAFDRTIELAPEQDASQRAATVARTIAVLAPGIEAGTVTPDRDDVAIPSEARDECEPCPEPLPPAELPPEPVVVPPEPPREDPPRLEIGPGVRLSVGTGLGAPREVDRFAGGGGSVDVALRLRSGAVVLAGARFVTRTGGDEDAPRTRVNRLRVLVAGGYAWRPAAGAFELESLAGLSVEPWWVRRDGERVSFDEPSPPLIGGILRLAPGGVVRRERVALRFGAFAELALAWLPRAGAGVARVSASRNGVLTPLFRVGGPEVVFGLEARAWFGVR